MEAIRRKIYFVIVMLMAAVGASVAICIRGKRFAPVTNNVLITAKTISFKRGEKLFKENCSLCHRKWCTGETPNLVGLEERLPDTLIKQLLFYPDKTIASNNYLSYIFNKCNLVHPTFPQY